MLIYFVILHNNIIHLNMYCFRLALYVYEYLLHIGAQKAAQTFLNEVSNWLKFIFLYYITLVCLHIW